MKIKDYHIDIIKNNNQKKLLTFEQKLEIQLEMIEDHRILMCFEEGRNVSSCEAAIDWTTTKQADGCTYAEDFSRHYLCITNLKPTYYPYLLLIPKNNL